VFEVPAHIDVFLTIVSVVEIFKKGPGSLEALK